ncbi:MAG: translation initiation factor IF-3 [Candidatus Caccosoma sp.]|nr:translation initiation factor IF-3 [Candidatus Caccosoma sp.]
MSQFVRKVYLRAHLASFYFCKKEGIIINNSSFNNNRMPTNKNSDYLVNESIRFPKVLVIDANGNALGVKDRREALNMAKEANLDLFCISPQATPPVCKILDFGKHRYQLEKKRKENEKKQKAMIQDVKQIQLSPVIDTHDIETKARHSTNFLKNGDKVRVVVRFKGRQMAHPEVGEEVMNRFITMCSEVGVVEKKPVMDGRNLIATLTPKK